MNLCFFYSSHPIHAMAVDSNAQVKTIALQRGSSDTVTSAEVSSSDRYVNLLCWSVPEFYNMTHRLFLSREGMARLPLASLSEVNIFYFLCIQVVA